MREDLKEMYRKARDSDWVIKILVGIMMLITCIVVLIVFTGCSGVPSYSKTGSHTITINICETKNPSVVLDLDDDVDTDVVQEGISTQQETKLPEIIK